jgi:hypothetical protein
MGRISDPQSLNLYCYTMNNPLANVDPTGHSPEQKEKPMSLEFNPAAAAAVEGGQGTYADYGLGGVFNEHVTIVAPQEISAVATWIPSALTHNINFGNVEDAITADHTATGPNEPIWEGMKMYMEVALFLSGLGGVGAEGAAVVKGTAGAISIAGGAGGTTAEMAVVRTIA